MSIVFDKHTRLHQLRRVDIREGEIIESKTLEAGRIIKYNNNPAIVVGDDIIFEKGATFTDGSRQVSMQALLKRVERMEAFLQLLSVGLVLGRYDEDGNFEEIPFPDIRENPD